jgi:hypothetical protein
MTVWLASGASIAQDRWIVGVLAIDKEGGRASRESEHGGTEAVHAPKKSKKQNFFTQRSHSDCRTKAWREDAIGKWCKEASEEVGVGKSPRSEKEDRMGFMEGEACVNITERRYVYVYF